MFQEGDSVYIKDSAQIDIEGYAWNYINNHRTATVVLLLCDATKLDPPLSSSESMYVVVWAEPFKGGWDCWGQCLPGYGQIVTQKHMDLNFEASYEVVTVPNIDMDNNDENRSNQI